MYRIRILVSKLYSFHIILKQFKHEGVSLFTRTRTPIQIYTRLTKLYRVNIPVLYPVGVTAVIALVLRA